MTMKAKLRRGERRAAERDAGAEGHANLYRASDGTWPRRRLAVAVSAALAGAAAEVASEQAKQAAGEIETIIVTATKRAQSIQEVSVAVQAVTGNTLRDLGVETFDEYVQYLPNVVSAGNGPGLRELYIRGSATEQAGITVATPQGSAPGVALYVDEQPVSFGGRNLDVYAVDMARVEVLSGPQGTLFGASSQSGNLRLITNKPEQGRFDAGFNAKYGHTTGGAGSYAADGFVNFAPTDRLAARITVYKDSQGGWIDNIAATFTPSGEVVDRNALGFGPLLTGAGSVATANNAALVEDDWNETVYTGGRVGLAFDIDDDWDALIQHTAQSLEVEGAFLADPSLGARDSVANFSPDHNNDEFGLTTWTLHGRIANLDLIYTGGHLGRDVDSIIDYTHYNNGGGYIAYYLCAGASGATATNCYDPTKPFAEDTSNTRNTHEFRIATDPAKRVRLLAGAYVNEMETNHVGDFHHMGVNLAFAEMAGVPGFTIGNIAVPTDGVNTSGPRSPITVFFNDYTRTEEETAFFGEIAFDVNSELSVSLSARHYDLTSALQGASNFSFGCRYGIGPDSMETADGRCNGVGYSNDVTLRLHTLGQYAATADESVILDARSPNGRRDLFRGGDPDPADDCIHNCNALRAIRNGRLDIDDFEQGGAINETDTIVKASVNWQPTNDAMLFLNYSEGYRPATQNRNAGQAARNQSGVYLNYVVPAAALTDRLSSWELGLKSEWLHGSLRLNATLYDTRIENLQVSRFDPSVAFLVFMENVGDAESRGLDVDLTWVLTPNLIIHSAFSCLDTELTRLSPQLEGVAVPVGSELPLAPVLSGNIRMRYDFPIPRLDANGYFSAALVYRGENVSGIVGSAEFMDDTLFRQFGSYSGLSIKYEGGTFGTVEIPDASGRRLPRNSRFVNKSARIVNLAVGMKRGAWRAEFYIDNLGNTDAPVMQIAGHYMPRVTVQRPRTAGLRFSYDFQ